MAQEKNGERKIKIRVGRGWVRQHFQKERASLLY